MPAICLRMMIHKPLLCLLVLFALPKLADAHEILPAVLDVEVGKKEAVLTYSLSLEPLMAGIDLSTHGNSEDSPQAATYDELVAVNAAEIPALFLEQWEDLNTGFLVQTAAGGSLTESNIKVDPADSAEEGTARIATVTLTYALPRAAKGIRVGFAPNYGALIVRYNGKENVEYNAFLTNGELSAPLEKVGGGFLGGLFGN